MTNRLYPKWLKALGEGDPTASLTGTITTSGDDALYAALCTNSYYYQATDEFYSSISGKTIAEQPILNTYMDASGVLHGDDVTFPLVAASQYASILVIYRHNDGANTTWRLVSYFDYQIMGLPVTTDGGNILIGWNYSGIFGL